MEYSPISQTDLKDGTLERLNRILKFIQEQIGRTQGLAGPFLFKDAIRWPKASMPGTELPPEGEAILNRTQIEKLIPIVVQDSLLGNVINVTGGGAPGPPGPPGTDSNTVELDGETVAY